MGIVRESFILKQEVEREHLIFDCKFTETFIADGIVGNISFTISNCTFDKDVNMSNFKSEQLIIKNCLFNANLNLQNVSIEEIQIENCLFNGNAYLTRVTAAFLKLWQNKTIEGQAIKLHKPSVQSLVITNKE